MVAGGEVVVFVMISDGHPGRRDSPRTPTSLGPFNLWRLLDRPGRARTGYGTAALDAVVAYLPAVPAPIVLWTSAGQGPGSPQPFYERYGFVATGDYPATKSMLRLDLRDR